MFPMRTILHPTDFSAYSEWAFRLACSLARDHGARLVVLHVAMPAVLTYGEGVFSPESAGYRDQLRERLHRVQPEDPGVQVEHCLVEGEAIPEILRVAKESGCDLIVMGTHGRTGLGRLLMGSVAEQVVRRAACPVLTVKAPQRPGTSHGEPVAAAPGTAVGAR